MKNKSINSTTLLSSTLYLALTLVYMLFIYLLSSIPGTMDYADEGIYSIIAWTPPALQNLLHIPLFGLLAWLWQQSLRHWLESRRLLYGWSFLLAGGYGIGDELHQLQVPGRYASLTDMGLNILGILAALWLTDRRQGPA